MRRDRKTGTVVVDRSGVPLSPILSSGRRMHVINPRPVDKGNGVFFILVLHGMAIFAPWNMFAVLSSHYYLNHKLSFDYVNSTITNHVELSTWHDNFVVRMAAIAVVTSSIFTILNCIIQIRHGRLGIRVSVSLLIMVACFIVNIFVAITDTGNALQLLIYLSLSVMFLMNAAHGVYHSSIWGIIATLPIEYSNAIVIGNNLIGICASLFAIIYAAFTPDIKITTGTFFLFGVVMMLIALITYFALTIKQFYRHFAFQFDPEEDRNDIASGFQLWKQHWVNFVDIFLAYFVTYAIYPNFAMYVNLAADATFIPIEEKFSHSIFCFLTFNVFAVIGNLIPTVAKRPGPRFLWVLTYARLLFLPLFCMLNYTRARRVHRFTILLPSSWLFWGLIFLLGFSHGYVSSLAMMYPSKLNANNPGTKAAMMSTIFLVVGIGAGLAFSLALDRFLLI